MEIMTSTAVTSTTDYVSFNYDYDLDVENTIIHTEVNKSLNIAYLVIYSLVFVLGVLGNGVVIWVTGFKMKKTVNTVWYLNLAVADFLITAFLPLKITHKALDDHWPFGNFMCKMEGTVFFMNMYASIYILVVISVDRCVCVVCPEWAQNHRSVRKASWVSLGVWVLALALGSPYLIFRDTQPSDSDYDKVRCYYNYATFTVDFSIAEVRKLGFGIMIITRFLMGFVVPFTVIVTCYSVIIYRLRKNRSLASQSRRPFKIIATVITTFFLCWVPYHIMYLISFVNWLVAEFSLKLDHGFPITTGLALLNSCLNPLLYVFMGQDFKDVFSRSILKVLEKVFAEELPQNTSTNPGSSIYETALSELQAPIEVFDTTSSLLTPPAPIPITSSSSTHLYNPEENITNICTSNIILYLPRNLPGERLFAVRIDLIKGISQASLKCLLDELLVKKVLNDSELEEAKAMQVKDDKARFVMDAVRNKGSAASSIMIKILREIDPFLSEHLGLED